MNFRRLIRSASLITAMYCTLAGTVFAQHYTRTDLNSNTGGTPNIPDTQLVNAWGLARGSGSPWWVSDNGTGVSTLYDATGAKQSLIVTIPLPKGQTEGNATPTGAIFNFTSAFVVHNDANTKSAPAVFIFVTEDGTISGWAPSVDGTHAILAKDRSGKAIYKGVALASTPDGPRLYATNFKTGRVEVFDGSFTLLNAHSSAFNLEGDAEGGHGEWSPFNIQNVGGNLVVTWAKREPGSTDELHGPGLGRVTIHDVNGRLLRRLQSGPWLNAPWGVALAPSDFGVFSHHLLIGNFGDGTINAFNIVTGKHEGTLLAVGGSTPLVIDGLWAISFGGNALSFNGTTLVANRNGFGNELFFTAGPNDESNGLFGKITAPTTEQRGNAQ